MDIISVNPADGKPLETYRSMEADEVASKITLASQAQQSWRRQPMEQRAGLLENAARVLESGKNQWARLMTLEMGKPLTQAVSEVEKCATACRFYAQHGPEFLAPRQVKTEAFRSQVVFEPLGLILGVMPWNFPFWQVFRFAIPALMAGNGALLKHASNVPGCALAIEKIFRDAGFSEGLFQTLLIPSQQTAAVIAHPLVSAVSLTGSSPAGKAVAAQAGSLVKKTVLELGGSDAYIVLSDADLAQAAETCVSSRLINNGESCIAAKRFIVVESVSEEFTARFITLMASKRCADPMEKETDIGPMARTDLRADLHNQVQKSIQLGAVCRLGGKIPEGPGAYYPATVLTGVKKGMPAFDEELFGPVGAIITARDEEEAIRLANDSPFGLGAAVFTADKERGEFIAAHRLEAGNCFVNALVRSDPRLPFGGIKQSGYGRELGSFGILEFVNIKTVYVK